jgi:hypothetical protein
MPRAKSTTKTWIQWWQQPRFAQLRRKFLPGVLFAVGVYFAQKFLQELAGTALWYPPQWREFVTVLGTAIGLACFNWARLTAEPTARDRQGEVRLQHRTLSFYALVVLLVCGFQFLRHHTVYHWQPSDGWVESYELDNTTTDNLQDFVELSRVAPLSGGEDNVVLRGTVLVPMRFSQAGQEMLDSFAQQHHRDPIQYCLAYAEDDLLDLIRTEKLWLGLTIQAFLLLHLAILACAGAGFGSSYSLGESIAERLA